MGRSDSLLKAHSRDLGQRQHKQAKLHQSRLHTPCVHITNVLCMN